MVASILNRTKGFCDAICQLFNIEEGVNLGFLNVSQNIFDRYGLGNAISSILEQVLIMFRRHRLSLKITFSYYVLMIW